MRTVEIKVILSTVGSLLASIVFAVLNAVNNNPSLLGSLPPWLQFVLITIIPPVLAFLAGYVKSSTTSTVSSGFVFHSGGIITPGEDQNKIN